MKKSVNAYAVGVIALAMLSLMQSLFPIVISAQAIDKLNKTLEQQEFVSTQNAGNTTIAENKNYKDPKVKTVNSLPAMDIKTSPYPVGTGVNSNERLSPVDESTRNLAQSSAKSVQSIIDLKKTATEDVSKRAENKSEYTTKENIRIIEMGLK